MEYDFSCFYIQQNNSSLILQTHSVLLILCEHQQLCLNSAWRLQSVSAEQLLKVNKVIKASHVPYTHLAAMAPRGHVPSSFFCSITRTCGRREKEKRTPSASVAWKKRNASTFNMNLKTVVQKTADLFTSIYLIILKN